MTGEIIDLTSILAAGGEEGDLLVIDDRIITSGGYANAVADGRFRVITCGSTARLEQVLQHPPEGFNPVAALIDLDLGVDKPTGLEAVRILRNYPSTQRVIPALNTNALRSPHRELLAVLCAEAAGVPLLMATLEDDQVTSLRRYVVAAKQAAAADHRQVNVDGLAVIHPVTVVRANGDTRTLAGLLAGGRWKQTFWSELNRTSMVEEAHSKAMGTFGRPPRGVIDDMQANGRAMLKNDLGLLPLALHVNGGSFLDLKGGQLRLGDAELYDETDGNIPRATMLVKFAEKYGATLTDEDLYVDQAA